MSLGPAAAFQEFGNAAGDRSFHSNLAFYEVILSYGPLEDPRPIFLMANSYIINRQQAYGISFLEKLLAIYGGQMTHVLTSS